MAKSKVYKPITPGRRGMSVRDTAAITKSKPAKSLVVSKKQSGGRNQQGKLTVRHRGGGAKRLYRLVDFKNIEGDVKVVAIEYDPNRSANIALVEDKLGKPHYVLAGARMRVGQTLKTANKAEVKAGNRLKLKHMPLGSSVYNIELNPGKGGQIARSAGSSARLSAKDGKYAHIRMPSGEVRLILLECFATLGSVGNPSHQNIKWGSAGRRRRLGWRPAVRGKAMNPVDHPMGGGEGVSGPGRLPRTPWGEIAIGKKTRRRKQTSKYVVRSRKQARRK